SQWRARPSPRTSAATSAESSPRTRSCSNRAATTSCSWLFDHPGEKEVPARVKQALANVKRCLHSKRRKRKARKATEAAASAGTVVVKRPVSKNGLEVLEEQIDECLIAARMLDAEG